MLDILIVASVVALILYVAIWTLLSGRRAPAPPSPRSLDDDLNELAWRWPPR